MDDMSSKEKEKLKQKRRKREIDVDVPETIKLKIQTAIKKNKFVYSTLINEYNYGSSDFDISFDKTMETFFSIKNLHEIIAEPMKEAKMTPKKIKRNPVFDLSISTPLGEWIDGKSVRYAMKYKIGNSYSKFGPWSEPSIVDGRACPTLGVPLVAERITRLIYSKFDDGDPQLVAILDSKTERFRDINRDIYNLASVKNELGMVGIDALIKKGGNASAVFENGRRPIHVAAENGNVNISKAFFTADFEVKDDNGFTPLHLAMESNNDEFVNIFKDVNPQTNLGLTPLHIAAYEGYGIAVEKLIENGSNITAVDKKGFTPFHHAVFNGLYFNALANDAQSNLTALHIASINNYDDIVKELVEKVDINAKIEKFTALHLSTLFQSKETLNLLLKRIDVNAKAAFGWTALHFAVALEDKEMVEILAGSSDLNAKGAGDVTPLHMAVISQRGDIVQILIDKKSPLEEKTDSGLTALHIASQINDREIVAILIENGADLNATMPNGLIPAMISAQKGFLYPVKKYIEKYDGIAKDSIGNTLLHHACIGGSLQVVMYVAENRKEEIQSKNDDGAYPVHLAAFNGNDQIVEFFAKDMDASKLNEIVDNKGDGLLDYAVRGKRLTTLRYLIESKHLNVNILNKYGRSVLDDFYLYFVLYNDTDSNIALLLARYDARDNGKRTVLHLTARKGWLYLVKRLVLQSHSTIIDEDSHFRTPLDEAVENNQFDVVKYLIEVGRTKILDHKGEFGRNALHFAAMSSNLDIVKYLVEQKAISIDGRDDFMATPLHYAVRSGKLDTVEYLVRKGANVNARDNRGFSPIHDAAKNGTLSVIKFFVEKTNANMNAKTEEFKTPLELAIENNNQLVVEYLKRDKSIEILETYARRRRSIGMVQKEPNMVTLPLISDSKLDIKRFPICTNGTLLLFDVIIRKLTGRKYVGDISNGMPFAAVQACALDITREFESLMRRAGCPNGDFFRVYKDVAGKMSERKFDDVFTVLSSYVKRSGVESKEIEKFLSQLRLPMYAK